MEASAGGTNGSNATLVPVSGGTKFTRYLPSGNLIFSFTEADDLRVSAAREAELKALASQPADRIDYSDIPQLDDAFLARALPNPFFKPVKTHASVRIDADVLAWLKSQGKGYQTRMNAILREAMLRALHHKT